MEMKTMLEDINQT